MNNDIYIKFLSVNDLADIDLWNNLVGAQSLPAQALFDWKSSIDSIFFAQSFAILALNQEKKACGFSLLFISERDSTLWSTRFGFFATNQIVAETLFNEVKIIASRYNIQQCNITSGHINFNFLNPPIIKYSLSLPLIYSSERELWASIPHKTRNMIRKAEKTGVQITYNWKLLNEFYDLYVNRSLEKSLGIKPLTYFHALKNIFGDKAIFIGAVDNNILVAGMIFVSTHNIATYLHNASIVSSKYNGVNNLIMWQAMQFFYFKKIKYIDLSESSPKSTVFQFKKSLSNDIKTNYIYYYQVKFCAGNFLVLSINFFKRITHTLMLKLPNCYKKTYLSYLGRRGRVL